MWWSNLALIGENPDFSLIKFMIESALIILLLIWTLHDVLSVTLHFQLVTRAHLTLCSTNSARLSESKQARKGSHSLWPMMVVPFGTQTRSSTSMTQSNWKLPPLKSLISSNSTLAICAWSPEAGIWVVLGASWAENGIQDPLTLCTLRTPMATRLLLGKWKNIFNIAGKSSIKYFKFPNSQIPSFSN